VGTKVLPLAKLKPLITNWENGEKKRREREREREKCKRESGFFEDGGLKKKDW